MNLENVNGIDLSEFDATYQQAQDDARGNIPDG
jgi:hypothetical protein